MHFDSRGSKVLVIDNDRTTLEMVQIRLDVAGYHPLSARSSRAASSPIAARSSSGAARKAAQSTLKTWCRTYHPSRVAGASSDMGRDGRRTRDERQRAGHIEAGEASARAGRQRAPTSVRRKTPRLWAGRLRISCDSWDE